MHDVLQPDRLEHEQAYGWCAKSARRPSGGSRRCAPTMAAIAIESMNVTSPRSTRIRVAPASAALRKRVRSSPDEAMSTSP